LGEIAVNTKASEISVLVTMLALIPIASFADTRAGGEETISNVALDNACDESTDVWDVLDAEALTTTTHSNCIVTACSDVANASVGTTDNDYIFTISLSDTSPGLNTAAERSLELADNPNVNDPGSWPVCSTRFFSINPGTYTIYWLGCRESTADVPTTVNDTSLTIGCFNNSEL
jgi:hypothetical protein